MYLIELKEGDIKLRKYVADNEHLERLIETELPNYEYIKILKEIKDQVLIQCKDNNDKKRK